MPIARGLATIDALSRGGHDTSFAALDAALQDALLRRVADGTIDDGASTAMLMLDAAQLRLWFEDLRADAVRTYLGHPNSLARIGYSGVANGGDGFPKSGFARADEREAWEPSAIASRFS